MNNENQDNSEEIPKPDEQPVSSGSITDLLKFADQALKNPIISNAIKANPKQAKELINDYAGDYETMIYDYLKTSYPEIHEALLHVPDNEENRDTGRVPYKKFNNDVLDLDDEGYSMSQISEILSEKYNKRVYPMTVSRILKKADAEEKEEASDRAKPKGKSIEVLADVVAKKLPVQPQPQPDANMIRMIGAMNTFNRMVTASKWIGVSLISGIVGIVISKVIL